VLPISSSIQPAMIAATQPPAAAPPSLETDDKPLREAFDSFVGETFYAQMLSSMRKSQGQLDQVLAEQMTTANADTFTGPMFELFSLNRA
jgi:hypothetical protein